MRKKFVIAAAVLTGVAAGLIPAASGAGPFHNGAGTTTYAPRINDSAGPVTIATCNVPGTATTATTATVTASLASGSGLTTNKDTERVRVTASSDPVKAINLMGPNASGTETFAVPCPPAKATAEVTFTFQPQSCTKVQGSCSTYSNQTLSAGSVTGIVANAASR